MSRRLAVILALVLGLLSPAPPAAAQNAGTPLLEITRVNLWGGRLLIDGRARGPNRLIKIKGTSFQTRSRADKTFSFNLDYRTPDCRITLVSTAGEQELLISNCGPQGVTERGPWSASTEYRANDLAYYLGSTWRAVRNNTGVTPGTSAADWTVFAQVGAQGDQGPEGQQGPAGMTPQGAWVDPNDEGGEAYEANDLVLHNGSTWIALVDDPDTEPGEDGSEEQWALFAAGGGPGVTPRGPWSGAEEYEENDLVSHSGSAWRALQYNFNSNPDSGIGDWELFASKGEPGSAPLPYVTGSECGPGSNLDMGSWQTVCQVTVFEPGTYLLNYTLEAVGAPPSGGMGYCPSFLTTEARTVTIGVEGSNDLMPASSNDEEPKFIFGGVRCPDTQHTGIALHSFTESAGIIAIQIFGTSISPTDATVTVMVRNAEATRIGDPVAPVVPLCGDWEITAPEACDDGNTDSGDGCSSICEIEPPAPICGNGVIEEPETCDDGNTLDGDACPATCQEEVGD